MMWRAIDSRTGSSGIYRRHSMVYENGIFESAYVAAYADIPDSCQLERYGEDYHDSDEVFIWGKYRTNIKQMGWRSVPEMLSAFRKRFKADRQFKAL